MTGEIVLPLATVVIVLAVAFGIAADLYKRRLAVREREMDLLSRQAAEKAAQYAAQSERLEQRVRVLERIATERGGDFAARLEGLRETEVN